MCRISTNSFVLAVQFCPLDWRFAFKNVFIKSLWKLNPKYYQVLLYSDIQNGRELFSFENSFFKKLSYLKLLCYCLPSGFSYIHVQILACFPVQFTNIKKYVQMATAIICDVMICSLNYSTHTTPISVLLLPSLYRMRQLSLHYFRITSLFTFFH